MGNVPSVRGDLLGGGAVTTEQLLRQELREAQETIQRLQDELEQVKADEAVQANGVRLLGEEVDSRDAEIERLDATIQRQAAELAEAERALSGPQEVLETRLGHSVYSLWCMYDAAARVLEPVKEERDKAQAELSRLRADAARLDWLGLPRNEGAALLGDDFGRWAVSGSGMQNIPDNPSIPSDINTSFFVSADDWKSSPREAIDAAMQETAPEVQG